MKYWDKSTKISRGLDICGYELPTNLQNFSHKDLTEMKKKLQKVWGELLFSETPCIVTVAVAVAVCEIFNVKEWCYLENRVRVRWKSLKMAPFDRSHTSSYSPSIVTMAVSLAISEIFRDIFDRPCMTFYWSAIVPIALSSTICELFDVE